LILLVTSFFAAAFRVVRPLATSSSRSASDSTDCQDQLSMSIGVAIAPLP
jgi:hypothetical protein